MKQKFFWLLLGILLVNIFYRAFLYRNELTSRYDAHYWENRYFRSQWVVPDSKESIGDDGLYAYVGWELIHGRDPTGVNAEMPPFGKYLIGLSIIIFGNQNIFAFLSGIGVLSALYLLSDRILKDRTFALLPVVLFSFEPLFYTQLRAPFLDLLYLMLLILTFLFYLSKRYILSFIFLGLMMATKASSATFVLALIAMVSYQVFQKDWKAFRKTLLFAPVCIAVFSFTYIQYFILGHGIREFLGVQKYVMHFYSIGAKGHINDIWSILISGQWLGPDGRLTVVRDWQITWIVLIFSLLWFWYSFFVNKYIHKEILLIAVWSSLYLLFLTFAGVPVFPRYLLVVLPFLYNLVICMCLPLILKSVKSK